MSADFVSQMDGFLAYSGPVWEEEKRKPEVVAELQKDPRRESVLRRAGSVLNISSDGYYNSDLFLKDMDKACDVVHKNSGALEGYLENNEPCGELTINYLSFP